MKSKLFIIFLSFLLLNLAGSSYCQNKVVVGLHGKSWNSIAELLPKDKAGSAQVIAFKIGLIRGIYEGIFLSRTPLDWPSFSNSYNTDKSYADLVNTLDGFYTNDENLAIPIAWAIEVVVARSKGEDDAKIQEMLTRMRKSAKELVDKTAAKTEANTGSQ